MANQYNRLAYAVGHGAFARMLYRTSAAASSGILIAVPMSICQFSYDPMNEETTESDSFGRAFSPTVAMISLRVDLRRRLDPVSMDAMGIRSLSWVDAVAIDIGNSGKCDVVYGMAVGPYERSADSKSIVMEGFTLLGGQMVARGITIPSWALTTLGSAGIPNLAGYVRTGVALPSGL